MNARTLSIAAVVAFASLGAQAADFNGLAGNAPADFVSAAQSVNARADVQGQARQAIAQSAFKNFHTATPSTESALTRAAVRQDAAYAVRSGRVATGDLG